MKPIPYITCMGVTLPFWDSESSDLGMSPNLKENLKNRLNGLLTSHGVKNVKLECFRTMMPKIDGWQENYFIHNMPVLVCEYRMDSEGNNLLYKISRPEVKQ